MKVSGMIDKQQAEFIQLRFGLTLKLILHAFEMPLSEFGAFYDKITEKDIAEYKKILKKHEKKGARRNENVVTHMHSDSYTFWHIDNQNCNN